MPIVEELTTISAKLKRIETMLMPGFTITMFSNPAHEAGALVAEAKDLIASSLSPLNEYSHQITTAWIAGTQRANGAPTAGSLSQIHFLIQAAIRAIQRKAQAPQLTGTQPRHPLYVSPTRIDQLLATKNRGFDFSKLAQLCVALNLVHEHECHHAVAMLVRAILDHIPPVFGMKSFTEVASNYGGGGTSFKKSMEHLQKTLRNIADGHLHTPIRVKEVLPTGAQVDFRAALDQLLAEVVRIS